MKKKLALLLVAAMTVTSLTACGGSQSDTTETTETASTAETTESAATEETAAAETTEDADAALLDTIAPDKIPVEDYVELGDYQNITVTVAPATVSESDIDDYITSALQNANAPEAGVTDRAPVDGDTVNIDYVGKMDGEAFDNGSDTGYNLTLGSGSFIDGFESAIVEKKIMPGETADIDVTFPDPYENNPDFAGKPAVFTVTVNYIVATLDDFNDTMAHALNEDCNTVEDYRAYAEEQLMASAQEDHDNEVQDAILTELVDGCTFTGTEIPEEVGNIWFNQVYQNILSQADYYSMLYQMDRETFVKYYYGYNSLAELRVMLGSNKQEYAKQFVAIQAVANKEGISVTEDEVMAQLEETAQQYGYESADALVEAGVDLEAQRFIMVYNQVMDLLESYTTVIDKEVTE